MPQQLLFFDLDDTLIDHKHAEHAAQRELHEEHASFFCNVEFADWLSHYRTANSALWDAFGRREIGRDDLLRRRFAEPLRALELDEERCHDLSRFYLAAYARHWRLVDGAEAILEEAARYGTVGVLSNGLTELQRAKMKRFALERFVSHVILSEEVGAMKPSREIFDAAARAGGNGAAGRKVYVGDSFATDVLGAKNAGWLPILYNPEARPLPAPVLFVTRLEDLAPLLQ
jgi:HAD superfamily hydrolase (TIGR01549 family)